MAGKYNVIVGAGMTGLTTGVILAERGEKCVIVERENTVGGLCATFVLDGVVFDLGPHLFFHDPNGEAERMMMDTIRDEKFITKRFRFAVHSGGRTYGFPLTIRDILSYPWAYKKQMIAGLLRKGNKPECDPASAKMVFAEKSGEKYYNDLFAGMLYKKTLIRGENLHRDWAVRVDRDVYNKKEPFVEMSGAGIVKRIINSLLKKKMYHYPADGFKVLPERMWDRFTKAGGETVLGCGNLSFEKTEGKISAVIAGGKRYEAKNVAWTGSINGLNEALAENAPRLPYVNVVILMITYKRAKTVSRPYVYEYYPEDGPMFNRLYFPDSIYGGVGDTEGVCLEINIAGGRNEIDENSIVERAADDLAKAGVFAKKDLRQSKMIFLEESTPVYSLDYEERMAKAYAGIRKYDNLYSVGRQGGYFFCLTPSAVSQGMKMARHIIEGSAKP